MTLSESEIEQCWTSNDDELVKTNKNKIDKAFDLKMSETVLQLNRCPVLLFQLYTGNRLKLCVKQTHLFIWYSTGSIKTPQNGIKIHQWAYTR